MSKIVTLAAAAAGYVLGARAGRERYEQIRKQSSRVWNDPRVQRRRSEAAEASRQAAAQAGAKATEAAKSAVDTAKDKVSGDDGQDEPTGPVAGTAPGVPPAR